MCKIFIFVLCNSTLDAKKVKFKNLLCEDVVHTVANSCAKYHLKITFLCWEIAAARCHVMEHAHFQKQPCKSRNTENLKNCTFNCVYHLIMVNWILLLFFYIQMHPFCVKLHISCLTGKNSPGHLAKYFDLLITERTLFIISLSFSLNLRLDENIPLSVCEKF